MSVKAVFKFNPSDVLDNFYDIDVEGFGSCCGASVIENYPENSLRGIIGQLRDSWREQRDEFEDDYETKTSAKLPSDKQLEKITIDWYTENLFDKRDTMLQPGHITLSILNETQIWLGPVLKAKGFRMVSDNTVNKNTGNRLYVFIRDPGTPKGKQVKKKLFRATDR